MAQNLFEATAGERQIADRHAPKDNKHVIDRPVDTCPIPGNLITPRQAAEDLIGQTLLAAGGGGRPWSGNCIGGASATSWSRAED
jgi:hypothetical protein